MIQNGLHIRHYQGNRTIPRWRLPIIHGGIEKFFGTLISFFRSFISFFRSFISRFRGEFSFARWSFPISSVETGLSEGVEVAIKCVYRAP